jgi:hypothetical protein
LVPTWRGRERLDDRVDVPGQYLGVVVDEVDVRRLGAVAGHPVQGLVALAGEPWRAGQQGGAVVDTDRVADLGEVCLVAGVGDQHLDPRRDRVDGGKRLRKVIGAVARADHDEPTSGVLLGHGVPAGREGRLDRVTANDVSE